MELSRKNRTEFVACSNNVISQHGERSCFKGRTISGGDEENNKNCAVETLLTNTFSHKDLDLFRDSEKNRQEHIHGRKYLDVPNSRTK